MDIKPEMVCYQPRGGSLEGVKYAAVKTPRGWSMEAMIPFLLAGLSPAANLPLGLEVALSDCDTPEPAQEEHGDHGHGALGLQPPASPGLRAWERRRTGHAAPRRSR